MARELRTIFFKTLTMVPVLYQIEVEDLRVMKTRKKCSISICVQYLRKRQRIDDTL